MNQTITRLSLYPFGRTHGAVLLSSDIIFIYQVEGMPNGELVQIVNLRAQGREPNWQIRYVALGAEIGHYRTAEQALAVLQHLVDDPSGLLASLHRAECEWLDRWGATPEHPLAKVAHRDVEAWERIINAHLRST